MMRVLDRAVVGRAALVALVVLVPPIVVLRALLGSDDDSALWSLIPVVFLAAFLVCGRAAAARAPTAPLLHAAVAGAAAFGLALLGGVVRNAIGGWSMSAAALVSALLFWQIATSLSMLGGFLALRRRRRTTEVERS